METKHTIQNELSWENKPIIKIGTVNIEDTFDVVSNALVILGRKCLDFVDDKEYTFKKSYRIEIVPVEHPQWEFQLHIPAEDWFDMLYYVKAKTVDEKNKVLATAREYVNSVRSTYRPSFPETSFPPILSKKYCATHANCVLDNKTGKRHNYRYAEPRIFCIENSVPQLNKKPGVCNWYAEDERIVIEETDYVVLSRQDHVREILVAPITHKTNRDLVLDSGFWKTILEKIVYNVLWNFSDSIYPVERYAINFGSWESETAKDKYALECHAHFHLHLSKTVVLNMEKQKDKYGEYYYRAIHGKINDPVQYSMQDCIELETLRLSSLEINSLCSCVYGLQKQINDLKVQILDELGSLKKLIASK